MKPSHISFKTIILLLCLLFPLFGNAQNVVEDTVVQNKINAYLQRFAVPGAAVLTYQNGKLNHYVFGYSDLNKKKPVTVNTLFELGSVTKSFTGLLLAQRVMAGDMRLDDPWFRFASKDQTYSSSTKQMTLLELATYTAGLPKDAKGLSYNAANTTHNQKNLTRFLETWSASYPVGTHLLYSNLSFSLLGMALAKSENMSLNELMQRDIFKPLGMPDATLTITKDDNDYAQGYDAKGKPARTASGGLLASSWALKASTQDMEGYLKAAVGEAQIPSKLRTAMQMAQTGYLEIPSATNGLRVGLGWFIIPLEKLSQKDLDTLAGKRSEPRLVKELASPKFDANSLIDKTGATNGFRAYIGVIPTKRTGIVILTNRFTYHGGALRDMGRMLLVDMASVPVN